MGALNFGNELLSRIQGEVIDGRTGRHLDAEGLKAAILVCAAAMIEQVGRIPGPVLLVLELSLESVVAYLGALVSGRTVMPMDAKEWQQKGAEIIDFTQPAVCWLPARMKNAAVFGFDLPRVIYGSSGDALGGTSSSLSRDSVHDKDLIAGARLLAPTSGSTGKPSLVRVTDGNLLANTKDIVKSQQLSLHDKAMLCLPLNYCFGASVLHSHLWAGGSVVVDDRLMFAEKVLDAIDSKGCTAFAGVPTSFLFLHSHSTVLKRKFSKLRLWLQAGGCLSADIVHAFRAAHPQVSFMIMYGQTEATARIASFTVDNDDYPHGCVGYPMASLEIQIRTEHGLPVKPGEQGEVWIRGASVCAGYFCDPEREEEKFVDDWLNTRDVGWLTDDNRLCVTGRSDSFIKVRGRRVCSFEIEEFVWKTFGVRSCACAVSDYSSGEAIGLYLESSAVDSWSEVEESEIEGKPVLSDAADNSMIDSEWRKRIQSVLPKHWDLGPVICGKKLPLTSNGKTDRRACLVMLEKAGARQ